MRAGGRGEEAAASVDHKRAVLLTFLTVLLSDYLKETALVLEVIVGRRGRETVRRPCLVELLMG